MAIVVIVVRRACRNIRFFTLCGDGGRHAQVQSGRRFKTRIHFQYDFVHGWCAVDTHIVIVRVEATLGTIRARRLVVVDRLLVRGSIRGGGRQFDIVVAIVHLHYYCVLCKRAHSCIDFRLERLHFWYSSFANAFI